MSGPTRDELEKAAAQCSDNAIEMEHCADVLFAHDADIDEHPEFCYRIGEFLMREAEKQWTMCAGFHAQAEHRIGPMATKPDHS